MQTLELENINLVELTSIEQIELEGGGWISDAVAAVVHWVNCGCNANPVQNSPITGTNPTHFM